MATRPNKAALSAATSVDELAMQATAQQEAARLRQLDVAGKVIAEIIGDIKVTSQAIADLETQVRQGKESLSGNVDGAGKYESAYLNLGAAAHKGKWSADTCKAALMTAIKVHYPNNAEDTIGAVGKLKTYLGRAMNEAVRGNLPAIIKPWVDAWLAEAGQDDTPLRDKFHSRQVMVEAAIKLAIGEPGKANKAGKITGAVAPIIYASEDGVSDWVEANPRKGKEPKPGSNAAPAAPAPAAPADIKSRPVAESRVTALINAVNEVASDYPAATALFAAVLADLRKCTSDLLLPTAAPKAAPAEPVAGAADLDDAMGDDVAALRTQLEIAELKAKIAALSGK